ncbi:MAG: hypothetical protein QY326_10015 [Bdellovibrionota bacterium]|nr:MAG: hypothetical protein QY326_10015 [Bdellovibrionota bacterium]
MCKILVLFLCALCVPSFLLAEVSKPKAKELPQSGVLSESATAGTRAEVANPWGDVGLGGDDAAPISGSISRGKGNNWIMKVFNNSEDPYTVNLEVEQLTANGTRARSDYYSYTLKGGANAEQPISATPQVKDMRLKLRNWKNLAPKKEEAAPKDAPKAEGAEGAQENADNTEAGE